MNTRESFRKTLMATSAALAATVLVAAAAQSQALAVDQNHTLRPAIAFSSTRDNPTANPLLAAEIYLIDPDGTNPRRLTDNADGDGFAALSPDGMKIVFDSNRLRPDDDHLNTSDLFVMDVAEALDDALGGELWLVRGSSATWSPDGKYIAYHASASGVGEPNDPTPGAATEDSDIFVLNVDDVLAGLAEPINLTNDGAGEAESGRGIDDDADWLPVLGAEKIVFVSHPSTDHPTLPPFNKPHAEIYVMNTDGTGRVRLTHNDWEERGPAWSPGGRRIAYMCRKGGPDFEICVMNADGTGEVQLTNNTVGDLTPTWSPDGTQIVFHRSPANQLFVMNADGTGVKQITNTPDNPSPGTNVLANWGEVRIRVKDE